MEVVVDLTRDDNLIQRIEIAGEPRSLPRARTSWRSKQKYYNPATKDLNDFKNVVRSAIPQIALGYLYPTGVPVSITLIFYMKRPNYDFTNGQRETGRLKSMLPWIRPQVPDIDNLAKFILDGMNALVYEDDRQVVKLVIYKLLDNEGQCKGRTIVLVSAFDQVRDLPVAL